MTTNHTTTPNPNQKAKITGWSQAITNLRCSHPLCNSQQTHNHHPTHRNTLTNTTHQCSHDAAIRPGSSRPRKNNPHPANGNMFVFSGPNRVSTATTNRTQPTVPYPHPINPGSRSY